MSEAVEKHLEKIALELRDRSAKYSIEVLELKHQLAQQKALLEEACGIMSIVLPENIVKAGSVGNVYIEANGAIRLFLEKVKKK